MKFAIIGLGKMGYNLALNARDKGFSVIAFNRSKEKVDIAKEDGMIPAYTIEEVISKFESDRKVIWLMLPSGDVTESMLETIIPLLNRNDIIIDGGNSNYKDSLRRYETLKKAGIDFCDVGTSGGTNGARYGACTMVGAEEEVFSYIEPLIKAISVENGYLHTGKPGSGHYAKMIHNGIEYGMMASIAEGFEILSKSEFNFDLEKLARVYNNGSVIRGWLMELMEDAFKKDANLSKIQGVMYSNGEGLWTVEEALRLNVPSFIIANSLFLRYRSLEEDTFSGKVVAALRNEFGGHAVKSKD
ncbi:MAG: decarboxylating 6-phosphogluconate dehydrogenase [Oscillospiraceae bacterium]|nr:decarboxylating 6-phosphogluconate dehydrogenase [Oscillospiraceae bacterium]